MSDRFKLQADGTYLIEASLNDVLNYTRDWSAWLPEGAEITSSAWSVPPGVTIGATDVEAASTTGWIGPIETPGDYWIGTKVSLSSGETYDRGFTLRAKARKS